MHQWRFHPYRCVVVLVSGLGIRFQQLAAAGLEQRIRLPSFEGTLPLVGLGTGFVECEGEQIDCDGPDFRYYLAALEMGCRVFDTAFVYGTEGPLGEAIEHWIGRGGRREELFIITKPPATAEFRCRELDECKFPHINNISHAIQISLRRLRLSYVDALIIHHAPEEMEQGTFRDQWEGLQIAWENGQTRMIGWPWDVGRQDDEPAPPGFLSDVFLRLVQEVRIPPSVFLCLQALECPEFGNAHPQVMQNIRSLTVMGGLSETLELFDIIGSHALEAAETIAQRRTTALNTTSARQVLLRYFLQAGVVGLAVPETLNLMHLQQNLAVNTMDPLSDDDIRHLRAQLPTIPFDDEARKLFQQQKQKLMEGVPEL
eukprot:TRINITY_DN33418_c0_g1_i1.p1 TRINITY_DN33418_c0_g1~~TRINITY_DN33418_c0_g1_i1.p1  ORF type:complete len:372 (-),score=55.60 TRINITY_DN33418_c0_g1_i1:140-1255(-)